jgi:hypothetical protein
MILFRNRHINRIMLAGLLDRWQSGGSSSGPSLSGTVPGWRCITERSSKKKIQAIGRRISELTNRR